MQDTMIVYEIKSKDTLLANEYISVAIHAFQVRAKLNSECEFKLVQIPSK